MRWFLCLILFVSCGTTSTSDPTVQTALDIARGLGDALLRQKGYAELNRSVPELVPIIDANHDNMLTLEEIEIFVQGALANPRNVALLVGTMLLLRR